MSAPNGLGTKVGKSGQNGQKSGHDLDPFGQ